ncbi:MAG: polymer-forming cytoskeletal protein [Bacilli bacterium]|nr:polymer-forming cytoskeletal protein [Bacilli bacterium]
MYKIQIYDDKTQGIIKSGNRFFINTIKSRTEAVFRASYVVGSNLYIDGKITASFDLIVLGDVYAQDIDIKGVFICLGNCKVENSITVQGKMFVKNIKAKNIEIHDELMAQSIDVDVLLVEGNVIVGKTLAVEISAESGLKILCGETAYGAGTLAAREIITGEELDMDDGKKSIMEPRRISPSELQENAIETFEKKLIYKNDYNSYLNKLQNNDTVSQETIWRWKKTLNEVSQIVRQDKFVCYDLGVLLSLVEISNSCYFNGWEKIAQWEQLFIEKFNKMANKQELEVPVNMSWKDFVVGQRIKHKTYGKGTIKEVDNSSAIKAKVEFDSGKIVNFQISIAMQFCSLVDDSVLSPDEILRLLFIKPKEYGEWISYLNILNIYGDKLSKNLCNVIMNLLYFVVGLQSKTIIDIFDENKGQ